MNKIKDIYWFILIDFQTSLSDLRTTLALKLRRELLFALREKNFYPDDPDKKEEIYNKYKKFIIPVGNIYMPFV